MKAVTFCILDGLLTKGLSSNACLNDTIWLMGLVMYYICNPQFESFDSWKMMAVQLRGNLLLAGASAGHGRFTQRGAEPLNIRMFFKVVSERRSNYASMSDHATMSDHARMDDRAMSDYGNADHASKSGHTFFNPLLN
jgi:hypothetical protein